MRASSGRSWGCPGFFIDAVDSEKAIALALMGRGKLKVGKSWKLKVQKEGVGRRRRVWRKRETNLLYFGANRRVLGFDSRGLRGRFYAPFRISIAYV
jgi:hypothetical protein